MDRPREFLLVYFHEKLTANFHKANPFLNSGRVCSRCREAALAPVYAGNLQPGGSGYGDVHISNKEFDR
ncbi:hypothetical protein [Pseudomonas putida]